MSRRIPTPHLFTPLEYAEAKLGEMGFVLRTSKTNRLNKTIEYNFSFGEDPTIKLSIPLEMNKGILGMQKERWDAIREQAKEILAGTISKPHSNGAKHIPLSDRDVEVELVLDANIISGLCTPRGKGRSWLDLLYLVSYFPNIKLVTTDTVMDHELCGRKAELANFGTNLNYHLTRKSAAENPDHKHRCEFAARATRIMPAEKGVIIIPGSPKMVIWSDYNSPGQKLNGSVPQSSIALHDEYVLAMGMDAGEQSLLRYCQSNHCLHPVIIISNDLTFFNAHFRENPKLVTKASHSIGYATGGDFFKALELALGKSHENRLSGLLHLQGLGEALPLSGVSDIANAISGKGYYGFHIPDSLKHMKRGDDWRGRKGPVLDEIFRKGIRLLEEEMQKSAAEKEPSPSWISRSRANSHRGPGITD